MLWFKSRYVQVLEEEINRLRRENQALHQRVDELVERLLTKGGAPRVQLEQPQTPAELIKSLVEGGNIFDEVHDEPKDEHPIVDNRKEQFDAFAS